MNHLGAAATLLFTACTIDPVARAALTGELTGAAIFQQSGTSDQVSYQLTLEGPDGSYTVQLAEGACGSGGQRWSWTGTIEIAGGAGTLRGVSQEWTVASGDANDVVGRAIVVEAATPVMACGVIYNSD